MSEVSVAVSSGRSPARAPVIRATISSPVVSVGASAADAAAGAHHPDLVAEPQDLGEVVADQQDGVALVAQPADQLLDLARSPGRRARRSARP